MGVEVSAILPELLTKIFSSPSQPVHSLFCNQLELKFQSFLYSPFVLKGKIKLSYASNFLVAVSFLYLLHVLRFLVRLLCLKSANHTKAYVLSIHTVLGSRYQSNCQTLRKWLTYWYRICCFQNQQGNIRHEPKADCDDPSQPMHLWW